MPLTLDCKPLAYLMQYQEKKYPSPSPVKNLGKPAVLVFSCSHNKTHKHSGLKERKFIILKFCGSEVQHRSHWLKSRCLQGCAPFWRVWAKSCFLAIPRLLGPLTFLGSWLPSSIFKASESSPSSFHALDSSYHFL